jgi:histidinol-phosphate aminotransferase
MAPVPSSANFVLVELGGADDVELAEALVRRGVLIRPGSELGLPGWARITVAPDDVMDRAAAALLETRDEVLGAGTGVAS